MPFPTWEQVINLLAFLAVILTVLSNLRWSDKYRKAKEAEITALKTRNETLEAISSKEFLEYMVEQKRKLAEIIKDQKMDLEKEIQKGKELESFIQEVLETAKEWADVAKEASRQRDILLAPIKSALSFLVESQASRENALIELRGLSDEIMVTEGVDVQLVNVRKQGKTTDRNS